MNTKAKPFIKWVGGKGQLIEQLEAKLPADFDNWDDATYIEPFVGGGAMLFYMLQQHPNIKYWGEDTGILIGITMVYERHLWNEEVKVI